MSFRKPDEASALYKSGRLVRFFAPRFPDSGAVFADVRTHWKLPERPFAVSVLRPGIPAEVIMRWTGHSDFDALRPHVRIVDELKRENRARFDRDTVSYMNLADRGGFR